MADDSRTEKATPKKRKDERKKGNIFLSQDVISLAMLLGSFLIIQTFFSSGLERVVEYLTECMEHIASWTDSSTGGMMKLMGELCFTAAVIVLPVLLLCTLIAIVATGAQTRFIFTAGNFAPKFSRLNPVEGIRKLLSLRNLVDLIKNLIKIAVLGVVVYQLLRTDMLSILRMMDVSPARAASYMLDMVMTMVLRVSLVFAAVAALDFFYQWWDYEKRLKMSKQEVKEEYKQLEGNPEIKNRIRNIQRQRAKSRMMQAVPQADVIIRNPTHFAVALRYHAGKDSAPVVIAKGQDELALRIVQKGEEYEVPVIENQPLARALYAAVNINEEIPAEYYGAVAEILVYVYRIRQKGTVN